MWIYLLKKRILKEIDDLILSVKWFSGSALKKPARYKNHYLLILLMNQNTFNNIKKEIWSYDRRDMGNKNCSKRTTKKKLRWGPKQRSKKADKRKQNT